MIFSAKTLSSTPAYKITDLIKSDPVKGISTIAQLNQLWATFSLNDKDWKQFERVIDRFQREDADFFDGFVKNFLLHQKEIGKNLKVINRFNEHLKMSKLLHVGKKERVVPIFGSARTKPGEKAYDDTVALSKYLVYRFEKEHKIKIVICTGAGPGQMRAGNQGAHESGAGSLGLKIELPFEADFNEFVHIGTTHDRFDTRIPSFQDISSPSVVMTKGGFGTFQEGWSYLNLWALQKEPLVDIVFYDEEGYFDKFFEWVDEILVKKYNYISPEVRKHMILVKSHEEVYDALNHSFKRKKLKKDSNAQTIFNTLAPYWEKIKNGNKLNSKDRFVQTIKDLTQTTGQPTISSEQEELKGALVAFVKHTVHAHKINLKSTFHSMNEILFSELRLEKLKNDRAVTFITPRGPVHPNAQDELNQIKEHLDDLKFPITFNHHDESVHQLLQAISNHTEENQIRIIEPTTPNLESLWDRPSRNHFHMALKRVFNVKTALILQSQAMVFTLTTPDGLDLLYELLCLIQTGKVKGEKYVEIILYGKEWLPLREEIHRNVLLKLGTINPEDIYIPTHFSEAQPMIQYLNKTMRK